MDIRDQIRIVPDFPKPGINFYDISTLLADAGAWRKTIDDLANLARPYEPDFIMGIEARGFLIASPLALEMGCGCGMIRKKGKLPGQTLSLKYDLEYGSDEIAIQPDLIPENARILLVDDLLATGGTLQAAERLIEKAGHQVAGSFCIVELDGLNGRAKLKAPFKALLKCPA